MTAQQFDPTDPLFQPLTLKQVLEITGRSRRTIERWVKEGSLTRYEERNRRNVVIGHAYAENQVVDLESEKTQASRQGRPRGSVDDGS